MQEITEPSIDARLPSEGLRPGDTVAATDSTTGASGPRQVERTIRTDDDKKFVDVTVAVEDGTYLGFAAYDTNRAGWFGPMGSSPAARGRGVGSALLRACLSDYLDAGRTSCEIAWVGPVDFYARTVEAEPGRTFLALCKPLDAGRAASA